MENNTQNNTANYQQQQTIIKEEPISFWKKAKYAIGALLALLLIILVFQNWNDIEINLLIGQVIIPFPLIVLFVLLTGYLWGTFSGYSKIRKRNREIRYLQQRVIEQNDALKTN